MPVEVLCPDGGACHHDCTLTCWRKCEGGCLPLSAYGDQWPGEDRPIRKGEMGVKFRVPLRHGTDPEIVEVDQYKLKMLLDRELVVLVVNTATAGLGHNVGSKDILSALAYPKEDKKDD